MSDDPDFIFKSEEEDAVLICMPLTMMLTPPVPSVVEVCSGCDCPIWVSLDSRDIKARRVCNKCLQGLEPSTEFRVTPKTRAHLNELGYSDEFIEAILPFVDQMIRSGR